MEKLLTFLVICVLVKTVENTNLTNFEEYARSAPGQPVFQKLPCSTEINVERELVSADAECGPPRKILFDLSHLPKAAHEEIHPRAIWVYQCVGLCDGHGEDFKCKPGKTILRHLPVKIVDIKTMRESCAAYTIEEPLTCTCCQDSKGEFCRGKGKVLVPRKCACNCPNQEEKRECLAKNLQWDRDKCTCEAQTRMAPHSPTAAEMFRMQLGAREEQLGLREPEDLQK